MNLNILQWFDPKVLIFMGISLILDNLVAYLWRKKLYKILGLKTYKSVQRIHLRETPRLGGFVFIMSLLAYVIYSKPNEVVILLKLILLSLIPVLIIGLKEDIFHNVSPSIRILAIIFAGWLFIANFSGPLPDISHISFIRELILLKGGVIMFFIISMAAIANGMNLIDGVNGLCGALYLSILGTLLFLCYKTADTPMLSLTFTLMLFLIPFMLLNYPKGLIFLGDTGAYSLGLIISMLTIIFFGRHPEISPWAAILILMYPITEVIFSILRRIFSDIAIFSPDTGHLHLKLFNFFRLHSSFKKIANALVTPTLTAVWIFPMLTISWVYNKLEFIWIAIILFLILYAIFYVTIVNMKRN